jgi:hypothetical protein
MIGYADDLYFAPKDIAYLSGSDINNTKINIGEGELWKFKDGWIYWKGK